MLSEEFKERLGSALMSELISYVAGYRAIGLNKEQSIACMVELGKRRDEGDDTPFEKEIEAQASILRTIGKGDIAIAMGGVDLDDLVSRIKESGTYCMITNRAENMIHLGVVDAGTALKIEAMPGVKEIVKEGKVLSNVIAGTKVSEKREDS